MANDPVSAGISNPLRELTQLGQSIWLDYIRRSMITSGKLRRLVEEDGLSGVTSNPSIFEKAINGSDDYDDAIRALLTRDPHADARALYEALAVEDVRMAADILSDVYRQSDGADGFVSLEVSPELAHDTGKTIAEAQRLWKELNRPNVLIKVPATPEGIPAIEKLIGMGINVNITLMFSMSHYEAVARAYLRGIEQCGDPRRVASVASFFVSRVDTAVDKALDDVRDPRAQTLKGRIGVANSKRVYQLYQEIFAGDGFARFRERGARVQRVLWASTSTKNPAYSDLLYVENLIGPNTVNTMPPETLDALRDHGRPRAATIQEGIEQARAQLELLKEIGVDLNSITEKLQEEGVAKFAAPFEKLLSGLEMKRRDILGIRLSRQTLDLGQYRVRISERQKDWQASDFVRRLWQKDSTVWSAEPDDSIVNRLGWLNLPESMRSQIKDLTDFAGRVKLEGKRHVVLLGMGGSSLAADVYQRILGNGPGYPELIVLDSTHPDAVRSLADRIDPINTLFLVSSKSGTTTEPHSFFRYFWRRVSQATQSPGNHFVAITDPGTPLVTLAEQRGFRRTFLATPDVGGRYSALTMFGLVPAALIGVDLLRLLDGASMMRESCSRKGEGAENAGLSLGAALGDLTLAGRDKVTFLSHPSMASFSAWAEQLIAESTGKEGKGIIPVASESAASAEAYGNDRVFIRLRLQGEGDGEAESLLSELKRAGHPVIEMHLAEKIDVGQEFFRWEFAIASAGAVLGINPFDQPDVELAKQLARKAMAGDSGPGLKKAKTILAARRKTLQDAAGKWLKDARPRNYLCIQAYLAPTPETTRSLEALRDRLRNVTHLACTLGYGPRFLHSTGQLHKGGPATGLYLQLVDEPEEELPVPETDYSFAALIRAQALGDYQALVQRGRHVLRINLRRDVPGGLKRIAEAL